MNSEELYKILKEKKFILSGPCVIENESMIMYLAENIKKILHMYLKQVLTKLTELLFQVIEDQD